MAEEDNKSKKLTLPSGKLTLGKALDSSALRERFINSRTSTVAVEVKKRSGSPVGYSEHDSAHTGTFSDDEVSKKLHLLKQAAEEAKQKEEARISAAEEKRLATAQISQSGQEVDEVAEKVENDDAKEVASVIETKEGAQPTAPQDLINLARQAQKHSKDAQEARDTDEEEVGNKRKIDPKNAPKPKVEEQRKLKKNDIFGMLSDDEGSDSATTKMRSLASIKRAREKEKRKQQVVKQDKVFREVILPETIAVGELANRMTERVSDVIRELMKLGIMAGATQMIDADTAELLITTFGHSVKRVQESDVENILQLQPDQEVDLLPRAPVVTVMGHVDHGKTSLLDALKSTDVAAGEAGGITQHIGAYRVVLRSGKAITFLDTPGHEAFTEMRTRGAQATDIVVLVVAADDGIMAQTIEAINHAKAANVPIIVAVNKIDKPGADIDRVKNELLQHELVSEDYGGEVMVIPVSALKKTNLDKLEEAILLLAEMLDLKANPNAVASGVVIESRLDKHRGNVTTVLVQRGTLRKGDILVAGEACGRVKVMMDDHGRSIDEASPSMPVEVLGLEAAPLAGDLFSVTPTEKQAREIAEYRARKAKDNKVSLTKRSSLEDLFMLASGTSRIKELPLVIKGDVQGSVEAIVGSLNKLVSDEVKLRILHTGIGGITESDVSLASASGAMVIGFNVRASNAALTLADKNRLDIRYYSIIYNLIDDVKAVMSGMLTPLKREEYIGSVDIRQIFNITKIGKIAGSYVTRGIIKRGAGVRLLRDNIVIHEGKLKTLKRFKDEVKEVREGFECGIAFENYDDIRQGDQVEVFEIIEERQTL